MKQTQRVAEIVKAALELEPREWPGFLAESCAGDSELRTEVESLLQFQKEASAFIEDPALHIAAQTLSREAVEGVPGPIAGYRVLAKIGEGGMGNVYLAEDETLGRKVALKVVRPFTSTAGIVARFRHEERILASLNQPNIAQLYGAGATPDGTPFFVMEYVEGARIDEYCRRENLSLRARLELFRKVCAAVQHAHQRLVIHRDLKPSNILVSAVSEPKLLDFGIAKLLEAENAPASFAPTLVGVMTPDYASPEQVRGEAITTASDVYSLGVVLYEMLTEARPYRSKSRRPEEVARAVTEELPARPSTVVADDPQSAIRNPKSLRGDLDNILLMALRKEPERRYSSVAQFAEDIRRHLEGRPVIARKDTVGYRTAKFIRRNKIAVGAAALVALSLLGGMIATARQAQIAIAARDRAQRQAIKAERVTTFLQNVLGFSDPGWASSNPERKRDATVEEALREATRRAGIELADEPEALAAVHFTVGNSYRTQSRLTEAEPHLRAALDLRRRVLGPANSETGQSMVALAEWAIASGQHAEGEKLLQEALPIFQAANDRRWLAIALSDMGAVKIRTADYSGAEKFLHQALDSAQDLPGGDRALRAIAYGQLGAARREQGDLNRAAEFLQKSIEEYRALPGEPRVELGAALNELAGVAYLQQDDDRASRLAGEAFELYQRALGESHQSTAYPLMLQAEIHYRHGDDARAHEQIAHALEIQKRALPPEHLDLARSRITLGKIMMRRGDSRAAEVDLRAALETLTRALPVGHGAIAAAQGALGECLTRQDRPAEAEPLLLASYAVFAKTGGDGDLRSKIARERLVALYQAWGRPDEAARYR